MSHFYDVEIKQYLSVIAGKDKRISYLISTIRKTLKMMQHPRLMQLATRELNFDKIEYTWEEKLNAAKKEINLTKKEEDEIKEMGIVLCPNTLKEFYSYVRSAEHTFDQEEKGKEMD